MSMITAKLGNICTIYTGTGFPVQYQGESSGDYPFFKVGDISKNVSKGHIYLTDCDNYISKEVARKIKGTIVPIDTVVFAKIGEAVKLNRRAITSTNCLVDNNAMGICPDQTKILLAYFYHYMCSVKLEKYAEATTVPSVKKSVVEKLEIPLPPIDEQHIISDTLDRIDDLILLRKQQLSQLDELVKSRFIELFGNSHYPRTTLINLIVEGAGLSYGIVQPGDDGTGDMGVLRPVDLVDGKISTAAIKYIDRSIGESFKKTELTGNELLITVRGTTGITALTDSRFVGMNVTRGIAVVRYDHSKVNPIYLRAYLNTDESQQYIQEHTRGATLQQINLSDLRNQQILVPPMAIQEQMAAFVEQTDKLKFTVRNTITNYTALILNHANFHWKRWAVYGKLEIQ